MRKVGRNVSANLEGTDNEKLEPHAKWLAAIALQPLLQKLQLLETEETDHNPEGVLSDNKDEDDSEDSDKLGEEGSDDGSDIEVIENPVAPSQNVSPRWYQLHKRNRIFKQ